ncbi:MAG: glycosyltransferase [Candidatus Rehaiarchaeum fermentans]|nr:glycosyltransferase [Candidatus Rehaiarchaeum fermentans]
MENIDKLNQVEIKEVERNGKGKRVAFVLPAFRGGGIEKVVIELAKGFFERNFDVDIVLAKAEGEFMDMLPKDSFIVDLNVPVRLRLIRSFFPLLHYFKMRKLDLVLPLFDSFEITPIVALRLLHIFKKSPVILYSIHNVSKNVDGFEGIKKVLAKTSIFFALRLSTGIVAVSRGVAEDYSKNFNIPLSKIEVIYNPIPIEDIINKGKEEVNHSWFANKSYPLILGVGRLNKQKDFPNLLRAFSILRNRIDARLVILGEGEERKNLENLANELGISEYVWMPGFVDNPYKYMSKASVFVLSSVYEGLPTVLIEALGLGVPVVSTDCPSGPSEILDGGKYGKLVPVENSQLLAEAILETLNNPQSCKVLIERAKEFSTENALRKYLDLFWRLYEER